MKRQLKIGLILACILLAAILFFYVSVYIVQSNDAKWQEGRRVAVVLPDSSPFWITIWNNINIAAQEYNIGISEYTCVSRNEISELLETALLAQVDGIIFCAPQTLDNNMYSTLALAKERGVILVCIDTDVGEYYRDVFVGVNNEFGGAMLADEIIADSNSKDRLLVVNNTEPSGAIVIRQHAFEERLEKRKNDHKKTIEYLGFGFRESTENILRLQEELEYEDIPDHIVAFSPGSTKKIASILKNMNLDDDISVLGFGEDADTLEYVKDGTIQLLIAQDCSQMAYTAVETIHTIFRGILTDSEILLDLVPITPENWMEDPLAKRIMEAE